MVASAAWSAGDKTGNASDEDLLLKVGAKIRQLRKQRGLSLQALSSGSGVSIGVVSEIERGIGNPSFNTLTQLAHALDISVRRLFDIPEQHSPVVRKADRRALDARDGIEGDARLEILTPSLQGALEAVWVTAPPGYDTSATPFSHPGEGFGVVLSGRHEVWLDGTCHVLEAGDSISYQCMTPHWYRNPGPQPVEALWIVTPPTF
ncbi:MULTISPECIES: helix-turn-helix domain-containing protein [Streptomyces]|uniref:DNA-binding protein n=1 Tax=Streptomyces violaceusniger TaxID=68280 RepID=A0A4D4KSD9_STRVO|nr:DNA-binding protein [Streptomyces violaceusniger]